MFAANQNFNFPVFVCVLKYFNNLREVSFKEKTAADAKVDKDDSQVFLRFCLSISVNIQVCY